MLRVDRLCVNVLLVGLIFIIPGIYYFPYVDELCSAFLMGVALLDCVVNNNWKRYSPLWVVVAILAFYAIYSLTVVHFNVPLAIALDWITELKPFIPFMVFFCVNPQLTDRDRIWIRRVCLFNAVFVGLLFLGGYSLVELFVFHVTYASNTIFICVLFYLYCSMDSDGKFSIRNLKIAVVLLTVGLLSARSKYYGVYIFTMYFLFGYKPGIMRHFTVKHAIATLGLFALILAASWHKISYYFLTGNGETFDPTTIESFARPVLYVTGFSILFDYFPFGTGLGSFATAASSKFYSNVYYEYGIDKVHGLAPNLDFDFICDAFYPSLAQFGVVGVVLFVIFWIYTYGFLRKGIRFCPKKMKNIFILGSLIIIFILVEGIAATTFTHVHGMYAMMLYGIICGRSHADLLRGKDSVVEPISTVTEFVKLRKI